MSGFQITVGMKMTLTGRKKRKEIGAVLWNFCGTDSSVDQESKKIGCRKGMKTVENGTLNLTRNEQQIIERGVTAIAKAKKEKWIVNLILIGFCILLFASLISLLPLGFEIEDIRGYKGSRPNFEQAEAKIMNSLFDVDYYPGDDLIMRTDNPMNDILSMAMHGRKEYKQVREAADYDYTKLTFIKPTTGYVIAVDIDYGLKQTEQYKQVAEEARVLFEAELDRREAIVQPMIRKNLAILFGIAMAWVGISWLFIRHCNKQRDQKFECIRAGKIQVYPGVMIGSAEYRSRNTHDFHIEMQTDSGRKMNIKVYRAQFDLFEAGKKCCAIAYPEMDNADDPEYFDLVWDGLGE